MTLAALCDGIAPTSGGVSIMGIGMRGTGAPITMPDIYSLPIYRVDKTVMQRVGDEIHILCGSVLFGQTQWSHISVIKIDAAIVESTKCRELAEDAFNDCAMMEMSANGGH